MTERIVTVPWEAIRGAFIGRLEAAVPGLNHAPHEFEYSLSVEGLRIHVTPLPEAVATREVRP